MAGAPKPAFSIDQNLLERRVKRILATYQAAQERISKELLKASLTPFKQFRLGEHLKQVKAVTAALTAELGDIQAGISDAYEMGLDVTRIALEKQGVTLGGLDMGNKLHTRAIQAVGDQMTQDLLGANLGMEQHGGRILRRIQALKLEEGRVNEIMAQGLVEGEARKTTSDRLTKYIREAVGEGAKVEVVGKDGKTRAYDPAQYAELVTRTRTREAVVEGNINGALEHGVTLFQVTLHEGACEQCVPFQGKVYSYNGQDKGFPVLERKPPFHPRCVLPKTPIWAPGKISASISPYDGPVIELTLTNSTRLTVTPNHMLLTPRGLVAADALSEGDDVIYSTVFERILRSNPHNNDAPPTIEQVVRAFSESSGVTTMTVPHAPEHFHGDGRFMNGNVNIVAPDSLLGRDFEAATFKEFLESHFIGADVNLFGLARSSGAAELLFGLGCAARGGMSGSRLLQPFLRSHFRRLESADFALSSSGGAVLSQDVVNDTLYDTEVAHQGSDGLTSKVTAADAVLGQRGADTGPNRDTLSLQDFGNQGTPDTQGIGDEGTGLSGEITLTHILVKREFHYSGHVYDLQTVSGLYIANGVVSSNCEHNLVPFVREAKPDEEVEALQELSADPSVLIGSPSEYRQALKAARAGGAAVSDELAFIRYRDFKPFMDDHGIEVDGFGQHGQIMRATATAITMLEKAGANIPEQIKVDAQHFEDKFRYPRRFPALYNSDTKDILVNSQAAYWVGSYDQMADRLHRDFERKKTFSSDLPEHAILHEAGHYGHDLKDSAKFLASKSFKFTRKQIATIRAQVGLYAAKGPEEFVAEVFAGLISGKRYTGDIMEWYNYFGGP